MGSVSALPCFVRTRMNLWDFEAIDWDDEEDPNGNLAHCLDHGVTEWVVYQVLREEPVEINMVVKTAEIALVGRTLVARCGPCCSIGRGSGATGCDPLRGGNLNPRKSKSGREAEADHE